MASDQLTFPLDHDLVLCKTHWFTYPAKKSSQSEVGLKSYHRGPEFGGGVRGVFRTLYLHNHQSVWQKSSYTL